jgi:phosphoribosylformimino-5-aminoimidazole carboxamide ribotide isomerase
MILFPAIDIKDGKVVRLEQGDYGKVTQYADDPVAVARQFAAQGAAWAHVVDLDAAKTGEPLNQAVVQRIAEEAGLKIQLGGGVRSVEMAQQYLRAGISRVVVGTQAVRDPSFLKKLGEGFPGKVALGLDTKEGKLAVAGWTETIELKIEAYLAGAPLQGIAALIFTDISRDGMLTGPNLKSLKKVLEISPVPVIASGGIASLEDLKSLRELKHPNLLGAIVGKALYEGKFTVEQALNILMDSGPKGPELQGTRD